MGIKQAKRITMLRFVFWRNENCLFSSCSKYYSCISLWFQSCSESQRRRISSSLLWRSRNLAVREPLSALARKSLKRELGARGRHQCVLWHRDDPAGWNRHESLGIRFKSRLAGKIEDLLEMLLRTPISIVYTGAAQNWQPGRWPGIDATEWNTNFTRRTEDRDCQKTND